MLRPCFEFGAFLFAGRQYWSKCCFGLHVREGGKSYWSIGSRLVWLGLARRGRVPRLSLSLLEWGRSDRLPFTVRKLAADQAVPALFPRFYYGFIPRFYYAFMRPVL